MAATHALRSSPLVLLCDFKYHILEDLIHDRNYFLRVFHQQNLKLLARGICGEVGNVEVKDLLTRLAHPAGVGLVQQHLAFLGRREHPRADAAFAIVRYAILDLEATHKFAECAHGLGHRYVGAPDRLHGTGIVFIVGWNSRNGEVERGRRGDGEM